MFKGLFSKKIKSEWILLESLRLELKQAKNIDKTLNIIRKLSNIMSLGYVNKYSFFLRTWRSSFFDIVDEKTMKDLDIKLEQFNKSFERAMELIDEINKASDDKQDLIEGKYQEQEKILSDLSVKIENIFFKSLDKLEKDYEKKVKLKQKKSAG
ncbi:MAG: hypothetical protein ACFFG0_13765 [Candidatus Thorarchaeota archaeon]